MVKSFIAFVLMGLGGLAVLFFLAASFPSLQHTAFILGQHVITWFKMVAAGMVGLVFYLASKV